MIEDIKLNECNMSNGKNIVTFYIEDVDLNTWNKDWFTTKVKE